MPALFERATLVQAPPDFEQRPAHKARWPHEVSATLSSRMKSVARASAASSSKRPRSVAGTRARSAPLSGRVTAALVEAARIARTSTSGSSTSARTRGKYSETTRHLWSVR